MLDGKRLNFDLATMQILLYGGQDVDPSYSAEARAWISAALALKPKDIQLYRDGSRWGVSFYEKPRIGKIMLFGTGGEINGNRDLMKDIFFNPDKYSTILNKESDPIRYFTPSYNAYTAGDRINKDSNIREDNRGKDN